MSLNRSKLSAHLKFKFKDGSEEKIPIIAIVMQYGVNIIPSAECYVAIGANISDSSLSQAVSQSTRAKITFGTKAFLYLTAEGDETSNKKWKFNDRLIFEGTVTAFGESASFSPGHSAAGLKVTLAHWLNDLQNSSLMASYLSPTLNNDEQFTMSIYGSDIAQSNTSAPGQQDQPGLVIGHVGAEVLDSLNSGEDIWGKGIKTMLTTMMEQGASAAGSSDDVPLCEAILDYPTQEAIDAMKRIQGPNYSRNANPTKLVGSNGDVPEPVLNNIFEMITAMPIDVYKQQNPLTRLIGPDGLLTSLGLMLLALPETAMVIPYCPILRETFGKIEAGDIISIESTASIDRPIKVAAVSGSAQDPANADQLAAAMNGESRAQTAFACYPPPDVAKNRPGGIAYHGAPPWLSMCPMIGNEGMIEGEGEGVIAPGAAGPPSEEQNQKAQNNESFNGIEEMYTEYAKFIYGTQVAQQNALTITSRLRFDISPGSMVEVTGKGQTSSSQNKLLFTTNVQATGYVNRMTYLINTSATGASQSVVQFYITHVRDNGTIQENPDIVMDRPPLYEKGFKGTELVQDG